MRGVTLVELVIVMVVVAILASVVALSYQSNDVKARYQAERLRTDLRHAQMLAITLNRPLLFSIIPGPPLKYSVSKLDSTTCATSLLIDPATNDPLGFSVEVDAGVTFTGTASFYLDYMGRPATCAVQSAACICTTASADPAATYTVAGGSASYTVQVKPVSGFVTVTP